MDGIGVTLVAYVISAMALMSWLTLRVPRTSGLMAAMIRTTFVPSKRRRYIQILSVEGSSINLAALAWGLSELGVLPAFIREISVAALLIVSVSSVVAVTYLGLDVRPLSEDDRVAIQREAPMLLRSLALLPAEAGSGPMNSVVGWPPVP